MNENSGSGSQFLGGTLPVAVTESPARRHSLLEQLRKPAGALAAATLAVALWRTEPSGGAMMRTAETSAGFVLVVAAVLGRLWCAIYIAGRKNAELCALGPYSLCRNPLYLFSSLGVAGIVLATHHATLTVAAFGIFWAYHWGVIRGEEARLGALFGKSFDDYRARVPRLWPRWRGYADASTMTVGLKPLRRSFSEVGWFFVLWLAADLIFATR